MRDSVEQEVGLPFVVAWAAEASSSSEHAVSASLDLHGSDVKPQAIPHFKFGP